MPFFYSKMRHPRPTSATVLKFGDHATRNVVELAPEQIVAFVLGRELVLEPSQIADIEGPGWVIGRHQGSPIGIGGCWQEDGGWWLKGMVPKAWAKQIDAAQSPR